MSGVFGLVDNRNGFPVGRTLQMMGASLSHKDWNQVDLLKVDNLGFGLGRIGIGVFNPDRQPVWDDTGSVGLLMAGELLKSEGTPELQATCFSDEEKALQCYLERGDDFAGTLNGTFCIAIWDSRRKKIVLTNDRFGSYQHYFLLRPRLLIFAPEVKAILTHPNAVGQLDLTALAQYIRFQQLLGLRTFWEEVRLFPPASVLSYDLSSAQADLHTYWQFSDLSFQPDITLDEAAKEAGRLLRQAVQRRTDDRFKKGIYLSGGLDSRALLGLTQTRPVMTFTYGNPECWDSVIAGKIAKAAGAEHHNFDLSDGKWVQEHADFHLELTEGFHSWIHAHGISTLETARSTTEVDLIGWDGGNLLSYFPIHGPMFTAPVSDASLATSLFRYLNQQATWPSMDEAEEASLYTDPILPSIRGLAFESFREELRPYLGLERNLRAVYFYWRNHVGRLTQNMLKMYRAYVDVRLPFIDYELTDFVFSLPARLRQGYKLQRAILQHEVPKMTLIPYEKDLMLPTSRTWLRKIHGLGVRAKYRVNKHVRPVFIQRPHLYADYENYLREDLRPWAENILFSPRASSRGLFREDYIRTLMQRHLSGYEQWTLGKIAPLITLEMVFRRYFD